MARRVARRAGRAGQPPQRAPADGGRRVVSHLPGDLAGGRRRFPAR